MSPKVPARQIVELQSIRGLAALAVMVGHTMSMYVQDLTYIRLLNGRAAVGIFFILSGYVLARMRQRETDLVAYGIRRLFRIYPALWVATTLAAVFVALMPHLHLDFTNTYVGLELTPDRLGPISIALAYLGLGAHLLSPAWTIAVELVGSAVVPLALLIPRRWFVPALIVAMVVGFVLWPYPFYSVLMYLPFFLVGTGIFLMPGGWLARIPAKGALMVVAAVVLVGGRACFDRPFGDPLLAFEEMVCAAYIIAAVARGAVPVPALRWWPLIWLGNVSYSLYLLHMAVFYFVATAFHAYGPHSSLAIMVCTVAVTLALSGACYRWVELPGIEMGRRVAAVRAQTVEA